MDKYRYFRSATIWTGSLAAISVGSFPLLGMMEQALSCGTDLNVCTGIAILVIYFVRPPLLVLFGIMLALTIIQRLRFLRFNILWALVAIIWILGSMPYLALQGFSSHTIATIVPIILISSLMTFIIFSRQYAITSLKAQLQYAWMVATISAAYVTAFIGSALAVWGLEVFSLTGNLIAARLGSADHALERFFILMSLGLPLIWAVGIATAIFAGSLLCILAIQSSDSP